MASITALNIPALAHGVKSSSKEGVSSSASGSVWTLDESQLAPLTLDGHLFTRSDLMNPASKDLCKKIKTFYEKILNHCESSLEGSGDFNFEIDISKDRGITLIQKQTFGPDRKINVLNEDGVNTSTEIQADLKALSEEFEKVKQKGLGEKVKPLSPIEAFLIRPMDWLSDVNGQFGADTVSILRNSLNAASPDAASSLKSIASVPLLYAIGGVSGTIVGGWLALKALAGAIGQFIEGDYKGGLRYLFLTIVNSAYAVFSLSMLGLIVGADLVIGAAFYSLLGFVTLCDLAADMYFGHQLNQQIKKIDIPETLVQALQWLQAQSQDKARFIRRVSEKDYEAVQKQITGSLLEDIQSGNENAIEQGFYLLESVKKENYSKLYVDACYLTITALGCLSVVVPVVQISSILFAVGATLWLFSGDLKRGFDLKEYMVNKLWNRTTCGKGYHHLFAEMQNTVKAAATTHTQTGAA